jgi:hypothetical protein
VEDLGHVSLDDAASFLFCEVSAPQHSKGTKVLRLTKAAEKNHEHDGDGEEASGLASVVPRGRAHLTAAALGLPPFNISNVFLLLPAAASLHAQGAVAGGVAAACLPMAVPFSVPQVSPDSWLANKRARAFHRCCVIGVYVQGASAVFKFMRGDLVGGTYDGLMALMGGYAIQPDGMRFFPTYIMCAGFNGLLGTFQVFQTYQGIPLHFLPLMACLPPIVGVATAYCGWQFCKELRAIAAGLPGDGPQDSCFVRFMGGDWWPASLSPMPQAEAAPSAGGFGGGATGASAAGGRFSAFAGDGHRLGEA